MDGAEESASSPGRGRRLPESSAGNCPVILTDDLSPHVERWDTSRELDPSAFAEIRRRMMLEGCKWDPQVGDVATLAPFPIVLPAVVAGALGRLAEQLAAEALAPSACPGGPARLPENVSACRVPSAARSRIPADPTPAAARVIRFDFHPTAEGWRISEANADVPGGYTESSLFPRLMARACPGTRPAGDPAAALADAIVAAMGRPGDRRPAGGYGLHGRPPGRRVPGPAPGRRGCTTVRRIPARSPGMEDMPG